MDSKEKELEKDVNKNVNTNSKEKELEKDVNDKTNKTDDKDNLEHKKKKIIILTTSIILGIIAIVLIIITPIFIQAYDDANKLKPRINKSTFGAKTNCKVVDVNGKEMDIFKQSEQVTKESCEGTDAWKYATHALIDHRDKNFYKHSGVEYFRMIKDSVSNKSSDDIYPDGRTITQQLVRLVITMDLSDRDHLSGNIKEAILAKDMESKFTKEEIITFYLNKANYRMASGIGNASKFFFGKELKDLNLAQIAYISAINDRPAKYDPYKNAHDGEIKGHYNSETKNGMKFILDAMKECGTINDKEYNEAVNFNVEETLQELKKATEDKISQKNDKVGTTALSPWAKQYMETCIYDKYAEEVKGRKRPYRSEFNSQQEYKKAYNSYEDFLAREVKSEVLSGDFIIEFSIDSEKQNELQKAIDEELAKKDELGKDNKNYKFQGAGVCIENSDKGSYVTAIVGGRSNNEGKIIEGSLNRAVGSGISATGGRQPGGLFGPVVVYGPAFDGKDKTYEPSSLIDNKNQESMNGQKVPKESQDDSRPEISIKEAIAESSNIAAWNLFGQLGGQKIAWDNYLRKMKFVSARNDGEASGQGMALGNLTYGVTALEMANIYSTFQRGGMYNVPTCVKSIKTKNGSSVTSEKDSSIRVYSENACKRLTECMKDVFDSSIGTAKNGKLDDGWECAGKTGTTTDYKDGWFVGYTNKYTTAIWCGNDDNAAGREDNAGSGHALSIWKNFMNEAHKGVTGVEKKLNIAAK